MKYLYILITPRVTFLGGAQLYVLRRAKFIQQKGDDALVITGEHNGNFILEKKFNGIPLINIPFLNDPINYNIIKYQKNILRNILSKYKNHEIIIESHTNKLAVWGELIAQKHKCKHIVYLLDYPKLDFISEFCYRNIFKYKFHRNEIIGISENFLPRMLNINKNNNPYVNIGIDKNELCETSIPKLNFDLFLNSFVIGSIGRLEKDYIEPMIKEVIHFANISNGMFSLIVAGDSDIPFKRNVLIKKYTNNNLTIKNNLKVYFPGYIEPLGKDFFKNIDIFIGQGTSVVNSISVGCPTLVVRKNGEITDGFLGIDTNCFGYSTSQNQWKLREKLIQIYTDKDLRIKAKLKGQILFESEFELNTCFKKFDKIIANSSKTKQYYNITILAICLSLTNNIKDYLRPLYYKLKHKKYIK